MRTIAICNLQLNTKTPTCFNPYNYYINQIMHLIKYIQKYV
jgi:hypothetical protein